MQVPTRQFYDLERLWQGAEQSRAQHAHDPSKPCGSLVAVGSKMPRWVEDGWQEYVKRLPSELPLELHEIPLNTRGKNADVARLIRQKARPCWARSSRASVSSRSRCTANPGAPSSWPRNSNAGGSMLATSTSWWAARKGWHLRSVHAASSAGRCRR